VLLKEEKDLLDSFFVTQLEKDIRCPDITLSLFELVHDPESSKVTQIDPRMPEQGFNGVKSFFSCTFWVITRAFPLSKFPLKRGGSFTIRP